MSEVQNVSNKERIINHEDGQNIISALQNIKNSYGQVLKKPSLASSMVPYTEGVTTNVLDYIDGFDSSRMIAYGDVTASEQGGKTCYIALKNKSDTWADGSTDVVEINWTLLGSDVSWATASDETIAMLIQMADAGEIDLAEDCGWEVGDERSVNLSAMSATGVGESHVAQTVELVLVAKDTGVANSNNPCYNYQYVTATSGRTYPSFIVQQKNGLANGTSGEFGYMNSSNTNSGSWNGCARRTWCNNVYKNAIPSTLRDIFKQVKVKTIATYNGSSIQESNDYFFLPAEKEVFGSASKSNSTEANVLSIWKYYETSANRIKLQRSSGSASSWWERSPSASNSGNFCYVGTIGNANHYTASNTYVLAPAGCI